MSDGRKDRIDKLKEQPVTYEAYASMPDDGQRYEVVDGRLELLSPGPSPQHQSISGRLELRLNESCSGEYVIFHAPLDLILSETDIRQPDILMIHRSRLSIVTSRGIEGPPDLVAEILSRGSRKRDRMDKPVTYAKYGIPEYWIVDGEAKTLEQYKLSGDRYELADLFEEDDVVDSAALPCVSFVLHELFADLHLFN